MAANPYTGPVLPLEAPQGGFRPYSGPLLPLDYAAEQGGPVLDRTWMEAVRDRGLGIGAAGLGQIAGVVNVANARTPWDDVPGGATAFGLLEAGAGLMGAAAPYLPDAIDERIALTRQGLAEQRAADPMSTQPRSDFADDFARQANEYADSARTAQSPVEHATRQRLADASDKGFVPALTEIAKSPSSLATAADSLFPSLALGGAVGRGAGLLGVSRSAQTTAQLGTMAGVEGASAGDHAASAVLQAPDEMLASDPLFLRVLDLTEGDTARARDVMADMARSVATTSGTAASALLQGIGARFGLNVAEETLLGRVTRGATSSRAANAGLGAVKEFVGEGAEGGANQIAQNLGTMMGGAEHDLFRGVGGAVALEASAGGPLGLAAGGLQTPQRVARTPLEAGAQMAEAALTQASAARVQSTPAPIPEISRVAPEPAQRVPDEASATPEAVTSIEPRPLPMTGTEAGRRIDSRLAALDAAGKDGRLSPEKAKALGREADELEQLVREQDRAAGEGVHLSPANRLTPEERQFAEQRRLDIRQELERHRASLGYEAQAGALRRRLDRIERDSDLIALAEDVQGDATPATREALSALSGQEGDADDSGSRPEMMATARPAPAAVDDSSDIGMRSSDARSAVEAMLGNRPVSPPDVPTTTRSNAVPQPVAEPSPNVRAVSRGTHGMFDGWSNAPRIEVVPNAESMPASVRRALPQGTKNEGGYDPATRTVYLDASSIAGPKRARWVAAHEVIGHHGVQGVLADIGKGQGSMRRSLSNVRQLRPVDELAQAIQRDRGRQGTKPSLDHATEEAIAEVIAAEETGGWSSLESRYGVSIPQRMRPGVIAGAARFVDQVRGLFNAIPESRASEFTASDWRGLVKGAYRYAKHGPRPYAGEVIPLSAAESNQVLDPDQVAEHAHAARIEALASRRGLDAETSRDLANLRERLPRDAVTGFYRSEERVSHVKRVIEHVAKTGTRAHYVEADIRNLGGLNAQLGHSGANRVYRELTNRLKAELEATGAHVVPMRHGGDEVSFTVAGVDGKALSRAVARAETRAEEYVRAEGLAGVAHPKGSAPGAGLVIASSPIEPGIGIEVLFGRVDRAVEARKQEIADGYGPRRAAGTRQDVAGGAQGVDRARGSEGSQGDRGGRAEGRGAPRTDEDGDAPGVGVRASTAAAPRLEPPSRYSRLIESGLRILRAPYESAADKLRRDPQTKPLGDAIAKYFDHTRRRLGRVNEILRPATKAAGGNDFRTFERVMAAIQNGRRDEARTLYGNAPKTAQAMVQAWSEVATLTGEDNQALKIQVFDARVNGWRPIGRIKTDPENFFIFWPRTIKTKYRQAMANPERYAKEWQELVDVLIADGRIQNEDEAGRYLNTQFRDETATDYFAGIERARTEPLPEALYSYSWDEAIRYAHKWAERASQIEAFGQAGPDQKGDLFDTTLAGLTRQRLQEHVQRVSDVVYGRRANRTVNRIAQGLSTLATGTQLGNPATSITNLVGGLTLTAQAFPMSHFLSAITNLGRMGDAINDAYAKGILIDDYMGIAADAERESMNQWLAKGTDWALKAGGYIPAETFVRVHNMLTAKSFLRSAFKHWNAEVTSNKSLRTIAWLRRGGFDYRTLLAENLEGPETDRFLRYAVNETQGSYRVDQIPVFMDEPLGRFLLKYQKFSTQVIRMFVRNHLQPFINSAFKGGERVEVEVDGEIVEERVRTFLPLLRYFAMAIPGGLIATGLRAALFGYGVPGPDDEEIKRALADNERAKSLALIMERAFTSVVAIGAFGFIGNYGQAAYAWQDRQRFKNPLDPPALGVFDAPAEAIIKLMDQGSLDGHDAQKFVEGVFSLYRVASRGAETMAIHTTESEFGRLAQAQRDRYWARKLARRYADETGIEGKRRAPDEPTFTENTPTNRQIKDALLLGEPERAKAILMGRLEDLEDPSPESIESLIASVRSSVRAGRPALVVESQSNAEALQFLAWAKENLTAEGYARLERTDATYMDAARRSGIWKPQPVDEHKRQRSKRVMSDAEARAYIARKMNG